MIDHTITFSSKKYTRHLFSDDQCVVLQVSDVCSLSTKVAKNPVHQRGIWKKVSGVLFPFPQHIIFQIGPIVVLINKM